MEFEIKEVDRHSEAYYDYGGFEEWDESVMIYIDGELHEDGGRYYCGERAAGESNYVDESTFLEKMKSNIPGEKPYDAIYMMAVVAATPEVEKIENKLRWDREAPERLKEELNRKKISEFMNNCRSEEDLKGFDVDVTPNLCTRGCGRAKVTLRNKANQEAVVEFREYEGENGKYCEQFDIIVKGKKIFHNEEYKDKEKVSHNFWKNMERSTMPPKPYDAICKMAVIVATPEVKKVEKEYVKKYLAEKKAREKEYKEWLKQEKIKKSLKRKVGFDFLNRGRS